MKKDNSFVKGLISKMSVEEKVGALLSLGFSGTIVRPHIYDFITKYHCGGLRLSPKTRNFGTYIDPNTGKAIVSVAEDKGYKKGMMAPSATASEYRGILEELQTIARNRPLSLPLHYCFDQEGGNSVDFNHCGVNVFPYPMGIRASNDPKMAYNVAKALSLQSRAIGFSWVHSPVLDINIDPNNPEIGIRAYSDRVDEVVTYAVESCRGFKEGGLIATGKHFPGRGDSCDDAHFKLAVINVDKDTMLKRELLPYKVLIEKDLLPSIMLAHSIFPAIDPDEIATVSKKVVTGLLRDELGFDGVITTDSMTMGALATRYGISNACAMSLEAGSDLILMKAETSLVGETFQAILDFIKCGRITIDELDKKVYRVLSTKYEYGLFDEPVIGEKTPEQVINDPKIRFVSKQAAKASVLVARDRKGTLPLSKDEKVLIIEQIDETPNNFSWHSGMIFNNSCKYNPNVSYLEVAFSHDDDDLKNIEEKIKHFDTIVLTNYFNRGKKLNKETIDLIFAQKGKKIVLVTNTPYEMTIPNNADTVIVSFSGGPYNMEVIAGTIFGEILPQGVWPIEYKLPK